MHHSLKELIEIFEETKIFEIEDENYINAFIYKLKNDYDYILNSHIKIN